MRALPSQDYELKVQKTEQLEHIVRMCPEAAQGLPDWLQQQGSAHTTALELRRLAHYRVVKAAMGLMEEARTVGRPCRRRCCARPNSRWQRWWRWRQTAALPAAASRGLLGSR